VGVIVPLGARQLSLTLGSVEHPLVSARGVSLEVGHLAEGPAQLTIATLRIGERTFSGVKLRCRALHWAAHRIECRGGSLSHGSGGVIPIRISYSHRSRSLDLALEPTPRERWSLQASLGSGDQEATLSFRNAHLDVISSVLPQLGAYQPAGGAEGLLRWSNRGGSGRLWGRVSVRDGSFSNAQGTIAGEKLGATLALEAVRKLSGWSWQVSARWNDGAAYVQPFYLGQPQLRLDAAGTLRDQAIHVATGRAELPGIGGADFSAQIDRSTFLVRTADVATGVIDLGRAAQLALAPVLASRGLPRFEFGGQARLRARVEGGALAGFQLRLEDASVSEGRGRFSLKGITGDVPWHRNTRTAAVIDVAGGMLGRLPLGAFALRPTLNGLSAQLPQARVPVLDSALVVEGLRVARVGGQWEWHLGGALQPMSLAALTEALGLPRMSGTVSASVPSIRHEGSMVSFDGGLVIQVFGGLLATTDLRLIEPFGRVPRLYADVEMRNLDLGQLTETFSFGSISGLVDAHVKGLELANWSATRFDAKVMTSPGEYRKRVSHRAVENITALGGPGAVAAIQRGFLRIFDEFGYRRLGWSCTLREGICDMGGIAEANGGYVIVKGGGVPAIDVIGYNRYVDWNELLTRLKRVTESNTKPIIR
jgi:hypothetical protein